MNKWQNETLGGYPVENLRPISMGVWKWQGEVTQPDGVKLTLTWTEDGYNGADERPRNNDLIPSLDPSKVQSRNRMMLALVATQYKRARDAAEVACEAQAQAHKALQSAMQNQRTPAVVVNIDGYPFLFRDDQIVGCYKIEVL